MSDFADRISGLENEEMAVYSYIIPPPNNNIPLPPWVLKLWIYLDLCVLRAHVRGISFSYIICLIMFNL